MEKKDISGKVRVNNASFNGVVNASSVDFKSSIVNNDNINACVAERGVAGFSPIANVVKSGDDVTITITDYRGTTTATIPDMSDEVERIESLIPHTASPTNKLVDSATLNSSVQTATSNFRGDWATYADIPSDASLYPVDAAGVRTPSTNDYLVVMTDEEKNGGTWRYKYVGLWSVDGKNGWQAEYQVNETPFTADQLAAINSGITSELVEEIGQGGGTGLQMFDTILKDHVLTFEESKGLALQGTYVYKEAVAGSRYGYPDFYNKVVEEYNESTVTPTWLKNNVTSVGGSFTDNYIFNGASGAYMQLPETAPLNTADSWEFKTKYTYDGGGTYPCILGTSDTTHYHNVHYIINGGTLKVYLSANGSSWNIANGLATTFTPVAGTTYYLKIGFTGSKYYVEYKIEGDETYTNCFELESTAKVYSSNPLMLMNEGNNLTTYYNLGSMDLSQTSLTIDGAVWWKGADFYNIYKNSNGHTFFNITEKELIDDIFASTGVAWLYGVDTENERVFLPRNNYFEQATGNGSEVGQSIEAGLPNITGTWQNYQNGYGAGSNSQCSYSGALYNAGSNGSKASSGDSASKGFIIGLDASRSNDIYGNSDTVQPNAVKKLLYICVGNTESVSSVTDVVEVTTTENDTIPLFTAQYFDFTPNNVSWLKAGQQKNSGGIYTFTYNELVNILNGETKYGNLKVINEADMIAGVDYSEYWKVNQDEMTFTTPSVAGLFPNNRILVAKKEPTDDDPSWCNWYSDGWCEQGGTGIVGKTTTEITLLKPYKDVNYSVITNTRDNNASGYQVCILSRTTTAFSWYYYNSVGTLPADWRACGYTEIPTVSDYTENVNLYFKVANAVQNLELLDAGEVLDALANKVDINSNIIDGQWVASFLELTTSTETGSLTLDLSTYLPNDGQIYDVKISCWCYESADSTTQIDIESDIIPMFNILRCGGYSRTNLQILDLPVGTARSITINKSAAVNTFSLSVVAYRRIGTNV